ncbi:MAG: hypothetical protein IKI93_01015 [Clostridia bacterium]|nr:hypothetical protein [Clostridia bacterium]
MSTREKLMEFITQRIVQYLMNDRDMKVDEAMNLFYNSIVFEKLHDEETGLYLESPLYVYDLLKNEIRNGRLVQEEI